MYALQLDNVSFLIFWFAIMFTTLSTGILVIMYRVGCFKCNRKIGIVDLPLGLGKRLMRSQQIMEEEGAMELQASENPGDGESHPHPSGQPPDGLQQHQLKQRIFQKQRSISQGDSDHGQKICTVCGDPIGPDEDEGGDNSHPSCRDMDASFL